MMNIKLNTAIRDITRKTGMAIIEAIINGPDAAYGGAYPFLKGKFYNRYDMTYSALSLFTDWDSPLITDARNIHEQILKFVADNPKQIATLYLDDLQALLRVPHDLFHGLSTDDLRTNDRKDV